MKMEKNQNGGNADRSYGGAYGSGYGTSGYGGGYSSGYGSGLNSYGSIRHVELAS